MNKDLILLMIFIHIVHPHHVTMLYLFNYTSFQATCLKERKKKKNIAFDLFQRDTQSYHYMAQMTNATPITIWVTFNHFNYLNSPIYLILFFFTLLTYPLKIIKYAFILQPPLPPSQYLIWTYKYKDVLRRDSFFIFF